MQISGAVFIGIESPDAATLTSTKKKQNTRRNLGACIEKVYPAGMFVTAGFIVGFDSERDCIAEEMVACIEEASLPICMVGMLTALPSTQLSRRLVQEQRLFPQRDFMFEDAKAGDQSAAGLNFDTARPRRDILRDYRDVLEQIYRPARFFARVRRVERLLGSPTHKVRISPQVLLSDLFTVGRLVWWLCVRQPGLWSYFARTAFDCAIRNPRALKQVISLMLIYLHVGPFAGRVVADLDREIAQIDAGTLVPRRHVAAFPKAATAAAPAGALG